VKIKDILQRDPTTHPLINQGQARIADEEGRALEESRGELSTFVCEGQYADGIQKIIRSFLDSINKTSQKGAWVSGFFGSGKSHLLKMLCHLWKDTVFPDGVTARSLVPAMPEDLRALLRELDIAGKRTGGLVAAAGSLPSGSIENVRATILGVLLKAVGLPWQYPLARFCLWLKENGHFEVVKASIESTGRNFDRELNNLYVSGPLMRAILACDPKFATDEAQVKQQIRAQFPPQSADITTEEFLRVAKDALKIAGKDGRLPCLLLVLDEVQLYIGESNDRSVLITEVAEALCKQFESQVALVCAGQSALTDSALLNRLMDRFTIRVPLSDAEVETVTRKVLLQKKPTAIADLRNLLDQHAGEVSRQLQGTRVGEVVEDKKIIVDDYPLLPVRRRFWEHCFRQIDAAGTSSQLRSQLRIIHDALERVSSAPLTAVIPADDLYDSLAPEMLNTGVLLRQIYERIIQVGRKDKLAGRICGLVFLIGKLKRDVSADIGVRASKDHLADLLVSDLDADNGKLRNVVEATLRRLADDGTLMVVGDEYRLQTREGAEWDRDFRTRQSKLAADERNLQFRRDQLLYAEAERVVRTIRLLQGAAKEPRQLAIHRDQTPPTEDGTAIPVWIRDGWSCSQKSVEEEARKSGTDSSTIFVFIDRKSPEELKHSIIEADAAQQTIDSRGNATTDEGREARSGMEGRRQRAECDRDRLVHEIVANARAYQGGGREVLLSAFNEKIRAAAEDSLIRLFPRFKEADSGAWEAVIRRARDGADNPFVPVGHSDTVENHPVCRRVSDTIGSGKTGGEVRKMLRANPYGWPQDAIDAALIALHRTQHITATLNGAPVALGHLDQNKISKSEFRVEQTTLTMPDRLRLRKLFGALGVACKTGEEVIKANEFLQTMLDLAAVAGGAPPLPPPPSVADIEELQQLVGNERLSRLRQHAEDLETKIVAWQSSRKLAAERIRSWAVLERLAGHAADLAGTKAVMDEVSAVWEHRLLLVPTDPIAALRQQLATQLRDSISTLAVAHQSAYKAAEEALAANAQWNQIDDGDRNDIRVAVGLIEMTLPDLSTDERILEALDRRSLRGMRAEADAIPGRVAHAIEQAAKLLEPRVQSIPLERTTLKTEPELDAWLDRQRRKLSDALKRGPVLVS
jgi:hypothetical protein